MKPPLGATVLVTLECGWIYAPPARMGLWGSEGNRVRKGFSPLPFGPAPESHMPDVTPPVAICLLGILSSSLRAGTSVSMTSTRFPRVVCAPPVHRAACFLYLQCVLLRCTMLIERFGIGGPLVQCAAIVVASDPVRYSNSNPHLTPLQGFWVVPWLGAKPKDKQREVLATALDHMRSGVLPAAKGGWRTHVCCSCANVRVCVRVRVLGEAGPVRTGARARVPAT